MAKTNFSISQNFIKDERLVRSLVDTAHISQNDTVVEIGAGRGSITRVLAERAGKVIAVERDAKLARELSSTFGFNPNVSIVDEDFMVYQLPNEKYKVVANIPFNKTAEIMNKLFYGKNGPTQAYLIMQEEAAKLYCGRPKQSLKSILLQARYQANILRKIDKREFIPQPKVDAAYVSFVLKESPEINDNDLKSFQDLVAYGYIHHAKDKSALRVLKDSKVFTSGQVEYFERNLGIGNRKVNELNFSDWVRIFSSYKSQVKPEVKRLVEDSYAKLQKQQTNLPKVHRTRIY